jgi:hypothetical protein
LIDITRGPHNVFPALTVVALLDWRSGGENGWDTTHKRWRPLVFQHHESAPAAGTGAIQVSNKIWVSMFRGDRVGIFPAK